MWGVGGGGGGAESVSLYNLSAYIRYTIEVSEQVRIRLYHKQQLDEITLSKIGLDLTTPPMIV